MLIRQEPPVVHLIVINADEETHPAAASAAPGRAAGTHHRQPVSVVAPAGLRLLVSTFPWASM
jgi:hypothetical protein